MEVLATVAYRLCIALAVLSIVISLAIFALRGSTGEKELLFLGYLFAFGFYFIGLGGLRVLTGKWPSKKPEVVSRSREAVSWMVPGVFVAPVILLYWGEIVGRQLGYRYLVFFTLAAVCIAGTIWLYAEIREIRGNWP
jgi:hypothetical protein